MLMRTAIIASVLLAATANFASAQNTLSPSNPMRPGMQGDDSSKPDGLQNNAGTGLPIEYGQPGADDGSLSYGSAAGGSMRGTTGSGGGWRAARRDTGGYVRGDTTGAGQGGMMDMGPGTPD